MKSLILALVLVSASIATQAHNITDISCAAGGKITIKGTQFDYNGNSDPKSDSVAFYLKSGNVYTWIGSAIVTSGGDFTTDIPYYTQSGQTVYFKQYQRSNTSSAYVQTFPSSGYSSGFIKDTRCTVMPITLTSWNATINKTNRDIVDLAWSVDMESNVSYYLIEASTDNGKTWDSVLRVNSKVGGNTNSKTDYTYAYTNPKVNITKDVAKNSNGATAILGLSLALGVIAVSLRSRGMIGVACVLILATVACKKSVDAPAQTYKYNAFRLSNVDNDGQNKTFETRFVKY